MIVFVESIGKIQVSVRAVREYRRLDGSTVVLMLDGGTEYEVEAEKWDQALRRANRTFISAASGTSALHPRLDDEGKLLVVRDAIIAWHLNDNGFAVPVTCSGTCALNEHFPAVLHAGGTIEDCGTLYESFEDWEVATHHGLLENWAASKEASIN